MNYRSPTQPANAKAAETKQATEPASKSSTDRRRTMPATKTKLAAHLWANRGEVAGQPLSQIMRLLRKDISEDFSSRAVAQILRDLDINYLLTPTPVGTVKRKYKLTSPQILGRIMLQLIVDIEQTIDATPGTLGDASGVRDLARKLAIGGMSLDELNKLADDAGMTGGFSENADALPDEDDFEEDEDEG